MPKNETSPTVPFDIHYDAAGEGPALLLLHGIGSNSRSWRRQLKAFSTRFRTIAWDAPGFGRSTDPASSASPSLVYYAESLARLLDYMKIEDAIILGHSMGGLIAQEFYRLAPKRVRSLILADTTRGGQAEPETVRRSKLENRLRLIRSRTPDALARERAPKLLSRSAAPDLLEEAIAIMSEVRTSGYEFASVAMSEADERGVIEGAAVPILLIWGAEDEVTPRWPDIPELAAVEIIPNAGHLCYAEQPDVFNSTVLSFLNDK